MNGSHWQRYPFSSLLWLESALLCGAIVTVFFNPPLNLSAQKCLPLPPMQTASAIAQIEFVAIVFLVGVTGMWLPNGAPRSRWLYLFNELGLCVIAFLLTYAPVWNVFLVGHSMVFLLLVVAIRGYLITPKSQHGLVVALTYGCLLLFDAIVFFYASPTADLRELVISMLYPLILGGLFFGVFLVLVNSLLRERDRQQELMQAHRQLQHYSQLIEGQAILRERTYIAREVHDAVGHYLTNQSIQLENASSLLSSDPVRAAYYLQKSRELGEFALSDVRNAVFALSEHPFTGGSLKTAFTKLLDDLTQSISIRLIATLDFEIFLPTEIAIALYRITQEALTNTVKHSQAQNVWIDLSRTESAIALSIRDDGIGFKLEDNSAGFGLRSMRERAEALGSVFQVLSSPHQGCTITVRIPDYGDGSSSFAGG